MCKFLPGSKGGLTYPGQGSASAQLQHTPKNPRRHLTLRVLPCAPTVAVLHTTSGQNRLGEGTSSSIDEVKVLSICSELRLGAPQDQLSTSDYLQALGLLPDFAAAASARGETN